MTNCKFILTKGKNKGQLCNKFNCTNHQTELNNLTFTTKNDYLERYISLYNNLTNIQKQKILKNIDNLSVLEKNSTEFYKNKLFLDNFFTLPFDKTFKINREHVMKLESDFDKNIYKMNDVKNELLNYLCKKCTNPDSTKNILALYGSPGLGKTKIVQTLSNILNYPMYTIPLGGVKDASYLLGHNYTFVESNYGEIVRGLIKTQCMNPIFYFDELDKISEANNGKEIYSILTFLTDPSQNLFFKDHYFGTNDITFDLSKSFFIFTFNDISKIDSVLLDRINVVNVSEYSYQDKKIILRDYNLKNILSNINKDLVNIKFRDECFDYILSCHSEFSLREYIFLLEKIVMEINKLVFLEKKNIIDFFDIDLNIFKTIHDKVTVKKQPSSHLSMYI